MSKLKIKNFIKISIWILVLLALIGVSGKTIDNIAKLFYGVILLSMLITYFIRRFIEDLGGDIFKNYYLTFEIHKLKFSVTIFAILVVILKSLILQD